jgi:hypothetical protein
VKSYRPLAAVTVFAIALFFVEPASLAHNLTDHSSDDPPEKSNIASAARQQDDRSDSEMCVSDANCLDINRGERTPSSIAPYPNVSPCAQQQILKYHPENPMWLAPAASDSCPKWSLWLGRPGEQNPEAAQLRNAIHWKPVLLQSLTFTTIMNVFRIATEPSTRKDLKGPFWKDYINSVKSVRGWQDGDEFLVNYIGHPMQGAVSGMILINNDSKSNHLSFGRSREYWMSRLKAFGWAAALSTQFELGPFGESSIGNVGLKPSDKSRHPAAYVDLVVTPVIGTGWLIGEDVLDKYLIRKIEKQTNNRLVRLLFRSFFNPSRSFANMLRGEWFWHRNDRPLREGGGGQSRTN